MSQLEVVVCNNRSDVALMIEMHKLRYRVFKERLDWEVAVSGQMEMDHYDISNPTYLALVDGDRTLLGSVRLLPTMGPNMLANTFPMLLGGGPAPAGPTIWESSRFCIDTEKTEAVVAGGLRRATPAIMAGMGEWALANGIDQIVTVTDLIVERILQRAGCVLTRLGEPMRIGKTRAVACRIDISEQQVATVLKAGELVGPMIRGPALEPVRRRA